MRVRVGPPRRPRVEEGTGDDAGPSRGGEPRGDVGPESTRRRHEGAVHVRLPRGGVGRDEQAGPSRPHLVGVVHDLRVPPVVQVPDGEARLRLREHVPVPVVVVADVGVVEHRRGRSLEGRPELPAVPLGHEVGPVGVVRRQDDQHRGVEHRPHAVVVARGEVVQEAKRGERAAHLGRVDREGHGDDGLPAPDDALRLLVAEPPGKGEARVRLADLLEALVVGLGGDRDHHERAPQRRPADLLDAEPVRGGIERLQVLEHLSPGGELPVLAGHEAEDGLGRGDGGGRGERRG